MILQYFQKKSSYFGTIAEKKLFVNQGIPDFIVKIFLTENNRNIIKNRILVQYGKILVYYTKIINELQLNNFLICTRSAPGKNFSNSLINIINDLITLVEIKQFSLGNNYE